MKNQLSGTKVKTFFEITKLFKVFFQYFFENICKKELPVGQLFENKRI